MVRSLDTPLAVAAEQLSHRQALQHLTMMMRLFEKCRVENLTHHYALLYEDLARKYWSERAVAMDPTLDRDVKTDKLNKELWEQARQRLASTLTAAGLSTSGHEGGASHASTSGGDSLSMAAVQRQQAASDAAARRADEARNRLNAEQRAADQRNAALVG